MKFDMREISIFEGRAMASQILILLDGEIVKRAVAFDTDADTVEIVDGVGGNVTPWANLDDAGVVERQKQGFGNYRGLVTRTRRGTVTVYRQVHAREELPDRTTLDGRAVDTLIGGR